MGRRSRKRAGASVHADAGDADGEPRVDEVPAGEAPAAEPPPTPSMAAAGSRRTTRPPRRRARLDEAPKPPWHPFPLVELSILSGIVLLALGYFSEAGRREVLFIGGLALVCVASLELVIREHFSGYRSHTSLLALASAFLVGAPVYLVTGDRRLTVVVAVAGAGLAFFLLRAAFARRAGGMSWRA